MFHKILRAAHQTRDTAIIEKSQRGNERIGRMADLLEDGVVEEREQKHQQYPIIHHGQARVGKRDILDYTEARHGVRLSGLPTYDKCCLSSSIDAESMTHTRHHTHTHTTHNKY